MRTGVLTHGPHKAKTTPRAIDSTNYSYEVWRTGYAASLNCYDNGSYVVYSKAADEAIVRFGPKFDEPKNFDQHGNFAADYKFPYKGVSFGTPFYLVGIQGNTTEPKTEFYIIDYWIIENTADTSVFGTRMGEFTVDGDTYDIWQNTANNYLGVQSDTSFKQYFSIRRTKRDSGHIDITAHFKKWEELGLKLGKITDVMALVEASQGKSYVSALQIDYFNITETADSTGTTAIAKRRAPTNANASDRKQAPLKYYKPDGARAQPGQRVRKFTR
ncbi:glycoside hydrolase family 11 protein [uncultured Fibrobacter sp.]|uniref:glycoside hydrolase family 11 protein n=1 Tax=uncultured Fibrobacter sp. TaxID=261512 RepID=UPI0025E80B10|nr:glycoside hydrolase family 11 protein [uncultured Fibrobacter sp.]